LGRPAVVAIEAEDGALFDHDAEVIEFSEERRLIHPMPRCSHPTVLMQVAFQRACGPGKIQEDCLFIKS
jgi:hypothetical protein